MHNRGIIRQSIKMALANIKNNKMRSFLTMLGIMIGVSAVIALVTIVQSVTTSIMNQFSELGAGRLMVSAPGTALKTGLTDSDIDTLRNLDNVDAVCPYLDFTTNAVEKSEIYEHVTIDGQDYTYFQRNKDDITYGRTFLLSETDGYVNVCIVDTTFATKVMGMANPVGRTVILDGYTYKIIGVYSDSDSLTGEMTDTSNSNGTVQMPYRNVSRMSGNYNITSMDVYITDGASTDDVEEELRSTLNAIYNNADNSFSVINLSSLMSTMSTVQSMLTTMLGGIAGISLVVGGIGIMNMMLVSVSERTKEIGLRKALGAEPYRIQMQFLIESITMSLIGGAIGIALGILLAVIGAAALNTSFHISYSAIILGAGFSAGVGIIFGWMPAKRASELNPIDALRAE